MAVPKLATARDIMTRNLVTMRADMPLYEAVSLLLDNDVSGAPVVDGAGALIGLLSELDCLRVVAAGEFHDHGHYAKTQVGDVMTAASHTIPPNLDLYAIAAELVKRRVRRLPVLENGKLIGQVSRRDVLAALDRDRRQRRRGRRYPDYPQGREPGDR
jgi:CBS domain-containing protein